MQDEYTYWLANINGVGRIKIFKLLEYFGNVRNIFLSDEGELTDCRILGPKQLSCFIQQRKQWDVKQEFDTFRSKNIGFTVYGDADYPQRLTQIPDAPYCLYFRGKLPDAKEKSLAVVGARCCSEYGKYMAEVFAGQLAKKGVQIISGMARGIDGISQRSALDAGGSSFGVLGCGVDICYPAENRYLYERLIAEGGILSEYPPGTQPKANLFPPRNRIISGLSDAVLVIEAREKSGTLITVDMALEQGKEVYALPGRVTDSLSRGCNSLIQQGAAAAWSPEELLRELYTMQESCTLEEEESTSGRIEEENPVYQLLDLTPKSLEQIYSDLLKVDGKWEISNLYNALLELQMKNMAKQIGQNHYIRQI